MTGEAAGIDLLMKCNVMTAVGVQLPQAVAALIAQHAAGAAAATAVGLAKQNFEDAASLVEQVTHLCWNLAEASPAAMALVDKGRLWMGLFECLNPKVFPVRIVAVAVQCLQTFSDDNPVFAATVAGTPKLVEHLMALLQPGIDGQTSRVSACVAGILMNSGVGTAEPAVTTAVLQSIGALLAVDTAAAMAGVVPVLQSAARANKLASGPDRAKLGSFKELLGAQQTALEVLANFCYTGGDDVGWGSDDGDDGAEAGGGAAGGADVDGGGPAKFALIATHQLPARVLARCTDISVGVRQMCAGNGEIGSNLLASYTSMQVRAISALGNVLAIVQPAGLAAGFVGTLWAGLYSLGSTSTASANPIFGESVTSTMFALVRRAIECPELAPQLVPTAAQLETLAKLAVSSADESTRVNLVGLMAGIGQLPLQAAALPGIGTVLVHAITAEQSPWVLSEALNGIFDCFAEPETNEVVAKLGMIKHLQVLAPKIAAALKSGALDAHVAGRLEEASLNLGPFLEYKEPQFK